MGEVFSGIESQWWCRGWRGGGWRNGESQLELNYSEPLLLGESLLELDYSQPLLTQHFQNQTFSLLARGMTHRVSQDDDLSFRNLHLNIPPPTPPLHSDYGHSPPVDSRPIRFLTATWLLG